MLWTTLTFGKHRSKTSPEIILDDPDWFLWILPELYDPLAVEAKDLARKARAIKIPKRNSEKWPVEYRWEEGDRFCEFSSVKASIPEYSKWSTRLPYLDLSWLRRRKAYDKRGNQNLIRDFRHHYFRDRNLTKKRCEAFFENAENFIDAHRSIQAGS